MGLIPHYEVDTYDEENFTPEQIEAAEFIAHLDNEGGIESLWLHGAVSDFPEELHDLALAFGDAFETLNTAITDWIHERGVSY